MNTDISRKTSAYISQIIYRINLCSTYKDLAYRLSEYLKSLIHYDCFLILRISEEDDHILKSYDVISDYPSLNGDNPLAGCSSGDNWTKYIKSPWSSVYRSSDEKSRMEWEQSFLYKHIYEPQGFYYSLQAVFVHDDIKLGAICLYKSREQGDFTEKDVNYLELFKAHIELKLFRLLNREKGFTLEPDPLAPQFMFSSTNAYEYGLTRREEEIIRHLLTGETDAQLCRQLCITKSTLDKHIHNIYRKTGARNRITLFQVFKA